MHDLHSSGNYDDTLGIPEEFYRVPYTHFSLDTLEGRRKLFQEYSISIQEYSNQDEGYEWELELTNEFKEFLKGQGLFEKKSEDYGPAWAMLKFEQDDEIASCRLLEISFEDDYDLDDEENPLLVTYNPLSAIPNLIMYESVFRRKFEEMGILEGLRRIIGIPCRVIHSFSKY
jgi:hypothetical protein